MALSTKCVFLRKPMETLILSQSHRQLFVDYTLKCPVMHEMLLNRTNSKDEKGILLFIFLFFFFPLLAFGPPLSDVIFLDLIFLRPSIRPSDLQWLKADIVGFFRTINFLAYLDGKSIKAKTLILRSLVVAQKFF